MIHCQTKSPAQSKLSFLHLQFTLFCSHCKLFPLVLGHISWKIVYRFLRSKRLAREINMLPFHDSHVSWICIWNFRKAMEDFPDLFFLLGFCYDCCSNVWTAYTLLYSWYFWLLVYCCFTHKANWIFKDIMIVPWTQSVHTSKAKYSCDQQTYEDMDRLWVLSW